MKDILKYFLMTSTGVYFVYFIYLVVDKGIRVKENGCYKSKSEQESDIKLRENNK